VIVFEQHYGLADSLLQIEVVVKGNTTRFGLLSYEFKLTGIAAF
jgi:hypothetical protein